MHDARISISRSGTIATVLWLTALALVGTSWVVMILDPGAWRWAGLFAITGCTTSAPAAVAQVHVFQLRMCSLIRISAGLEPAEQQFRKGLESVP